MKGKKRAGKTNQTHTAHHKYLVVGFIVKTSIIVLIGFKQNH